MTELRRSASELLLLLRIGVQIGTPKFQLRKRRWMSTRLNFKEKKLTIILITFLGWIVVRCRELAVDIITCERGRSAGRQSLSMCINIEGKLSFLWARTVHESATKRFQNKSRRLSTMIGGSPHRALSRSKSECKDFMVIESSNYPTYATRSIVDVIVSVSVGPDEIINLHYGIIDMRKLPRTKWFRDSSHHRLVPYQPSRYRHSRDAELESSQQKVSPRSAGG